MAEDVRPRVILGGMITNGNLLFFYVVMSLVFTVQVSFYSFPLHERAVALNLKVLFHTWYDNMLFLMLNHSELTLNTDKLFIFDIEEVEVWVHGDDPIILQPQD